MRKISIIANKNWEAEPMLAALCSGEFRPVGLPFPVLIKSNQDSKYSISPNDAVNCDANTRAIIHFMDPKDAAVVATEVKIWCVQDFMSKAPGVSSSSSEEKYRVLPPLLAAENPELVIAMGTAGYTGNQSYAGCVVIGSRFFVHNGNEKNTDSHMVSDEFEKLLPLNVNPDLFLKIFTPKFRPKVDPKLLKPPINPAAHITCLASPYYTAIGSVNVTDYGQYAWVDAEALKMFRKVEQSLPVGSLETTHGVIRLSSDKPCIFISAITDQEGNFDMEVIPGQNYTASFNAGIVIGQLITDLNDFLNQNQAFDFAKVPSVNNS